MVKYSLIILLLFTYSCNDARYRALETTRKLYTTSHSFKPEISQYELSQNTLKYLQMHFRFVYPYPDQMISIRSGIPMAFDDFQPAIPIPLQLAGENKSPLMDLTEQGVNLQNQGFFEKSIEIFERVNQESPYYPAIQIHKAYACQKIGDHKKAVNILKKSLTNTAGQEYIHKSLLFSRLSDVYLSTGDHNQAEKNNAAAMKNVQHVDNKFIQAVIMNNTGNFLSIKNQNHDALKSYHRALDILNISDSKNYSNDCMRLQSKVLINIARATLNYHLDCRGKTFTDIIIAINNSSFHTKQMLDSYDKASDFVSIGLLSNTIIDYLESQDVIMKDELISSFSTISNECFCEAKKIAEKFNFYKINSIACGYIGKKYETENKLDDAIIFTNSAIKNAEKIYIPGLLYQWFWQAGRQYLLKNDIEKAIKNYAQAIAILKPSENQNKIVSDVFKSLFLGYRQKIDIFSKKINPLFKETIDLLFKIALSTKDSNKRGIVLNYTDQIIDIQQTLEREHYFRTERIQSLPPEKKHFHIKLHNHATLYYKMVSDSLVIYFNNEHEKRLIQMKTNPDVLHQQIMNFYKSVEHCRPIEEYKPIACELYDLLIRPVEKVKQQIYSNINMLVIIPNDTFRKIPFSALVNRNDGKYLIQKYALAVHVRKVSNHPLDLIAITTSKVGYENLMNKKKLERFTLSKETKSTLASLWIPEKFIETVMSIECAKRLKLTEEAVTKADILRKIQNEIIDGNFGDEYKHPYYWSPYLISGNWM